MSDYDKVFELLHNECVSASCRLNEASCSAEWLYESGKRDGLFAILRSFERMVANEQQRER